MERQRIGIDAKWFFNGPVSNRLVVRQLTEQLVKQNPGHALFFFLNEADRHLPFPYAGPGVHLHYVWARNNQLSNLFVLPPLAHRLGLDVVLFQNFASFYGRFRKIAYIHDVLFHEYPQFYTRKERAYFSTMKALAARADLVCTISHAEKERLLRHGYQSDAARIHVIHHGVSPVFRPAESYPAAVLDDLRRRYRLPERYILYVGRLNVRKNIAGLLRAVPQLHDQTIPVVVVGAKDWKMEPLDGLIADMKLTDRLVFTGHVPDADIPGLFALATVFCFPSFAEGFGLPPLEAMASGVPVAVANTTSLPEVCGEAGTYLDPYDPASVAAALNRLLDDDAHARHQRTLGLRRAASFTWEKAGRELLRSIGSRGVEFGSLSVKESGS